MLVGMDISAGGSWTGPSVALGIGTAVVLLGLAATLALLLLRRPPRRRPSAGDVAAPGEYRDDDLPGFLESPPGTAGAPPTPRDGWAALGGTTVPPPLPAGRLARRDTAVVLATLAGTALLLVAVAAVLATAGSRGGPDRPSRGGGPEAVALPTVPTAPAPGAPGAGELAEVSVRPGPAGGAASLTFAGLVLEPRAVGVTVTYPVVDVTWDGERAVAHVRLPTYNCLAAAAPEDPAGCAAGPVEYADLPSPALTVTVDGGSVYVAGRFPTYLRPNGSPPVWTGRVYGLRITARPADGEPAAGRMPAEGEIRLGSGSAPTVEGPDVTLVLRD
jgi:hypothetical protein